MARFPTTPGPAILSRLLVTAQAGDRAPVGLGRARAARRRRRGAGRGWGQVLVEALGFRRRSAALAQRQDPDRADMGAQGKSQDIAGLYAVMRLENRRPGDPDLAGRG